MKHIELFKDGFDSTVQEKIQPENWPYVGNDGVSGEIVYTLVPEENESGYQMVDLGLPSGLKWADCNVGAETPQDNGLYFSWGNVDGHAVDEEGNVVDGYPFDSTTYASTSGGQFTGSTLDTEHDAATANMGNGWRMPVIEETRELHQNTDRYYIREDGSIVAKSELDGSKLCSICFVKKGDPFDYNTRGNFIEVPFAGRCYSSLLGNDGLQGIVWSASLYSEDKAVGLFFDSNGSLDGGYGSSSTWVRRAGIPVRGVHA